MLSRTVVTLIALTCCRAACGDCVPLRDIARTQNSSHRNVWCQAGKKAPAVAPTAGNARRNGAPLYKQTTKTANTTVAFVGRDDQTSGDWQSKYGRQAFIVPMRGGTAQFKDQGISLAFVNMSKNASKPDAVSLGGGEHEGGAPLFAWDMAVLSHDTRLLPAADGLKTRQPVTFRGEGALAVKSAATDGKPHQMTIYLLDYQRRGLSVRVEARDGLGHTVDTRAAANYAQGAYLRYRFKGSIELVVRSLTPSQPPLLTGVFVDAVPAP